MKARFVILILLCFFAISCNKKTEIIEMTNLDNYYNDGSAKVVYFVISNPPENKDSLLNLVSKHFQSFAPSDTIEKYFYYNHRYYKETRFTPRDYKEEWKDYFDHDYIDNHYKDLLIRIRIQPEYNIQEIIFYKKGNIEEEVRVGNPIIQTQNNQQ